MNNNDQVLYPLTKAQKTFFIGNLFTVQSGKDVFDNNIIVTGAYCPEEFDALAMEKAFNRLKLMNDSLRIRFVITPFAIKQRFNDYMYEKLPKISCGTREDFQRILFDTHPQMKLFGEKLYYAVIAVNEEDRSGGLMLYTHHTNSDGYSIQIFINALEKYYSKYVKNEEPEEEEVHTFVRQIQEEQAYLKGPQYKKDAKFWKDQYTRQRDMSFPAGRTPFNNSLRSQTFYIEGEEYDSFVKFCTDNKSAVASTMLTMMALTTLCATHKDNFCLFNLFNGRSSVKLRETAGDMFSTYGVFFDIPRDEKVCEYVKQRHTEYMKCMLHGRFPASATIKYCAKETYIKRFGYNYIWALMSYYDTASENEGRLLELMTPPERFIVGIFYCAIFNDMSSRRLEFIENYQGQVISDETASRLIVLIRRIISLCVENPEITIGELEKLTAKEAQGIKRKKRGKHD